MNLDQITTIDNVINELQEIVKKSINQNSTFGYFAALYLKVTEQVKEGINSGYFEDNERMEQLDVIFAKRYIEAYKNYHQGKPISSAWQKAFELSEKDWPIVLQYLMAGMNAHINLDLGIAAATVMEGKNIQLLENDFDKINTILSKLVEDVENDLSTIWPTLKRILRWTKGVDNFLVDFSMKLARDGAWKFALSLSDIPPNNWEYSINERDEKVTKNAKIILQPGWIVRLIFRIIRKGEKGTVAKRIDDLVK
ncbi:MAG: DUF5995 family protein [Crocinitomicaceae bacterium]|nr:DUF5995 family protein [Crocinitomicaceae bacterium]